MVKTTWQELECGCKLWLQIGEAKAGCIHWHDVDLLEEHKQEVNREYEEFKKLNKYNGENNDKENSKNTG